MGKGSTQELLKGVLQALSSPKSINEVAVETGFDRAAISKYLDVLKEGKVISEETDGRKRIFSIKTKLNLREDTYFGLPLTVEQEKEAFSLFNLIKRDWYKQTKKTLLKTHAQKIAYKAISDCKLVIPNGWYIYGGIGIVSYDDAKEYNYSGFPNEDEVKKCVNDITVEYAKNDYAWQSKKLQYDAAHKPLYEFKEHIFSILYSKNFEDHPINSLHMIINYLGRLFVYIPKEFRSEYLELLNSYKELMLDLTRLEIKVILEHKREITVLFEAIWKYIAMFNLKKDLLEQKYYTLEILNIHFYFDILKQEEEIIEYGSGLQSLVPEPEIKDPLRKQLHEALSHIKLLTPDEQEKQKEHLNKLKKELGHDKFQDYLLEQAGLK